jgi:hypothetical protein
MYLGLQITFDEAKRSAAHDSLPSVPVTSEADWSSDRFAIRIPKG